MSLSTLQPKQRVQARGEGVCITENLLKLQSCLKDSLNTQRAALKQISLPLLALVPAWGWDQRPRVRAPAVWHSLPPDPQKIHPWRKMKGVQS